MIDWRKQTVTDLVANPESWIRLGELFAGVESLIPTHLALRRTANTKGDVGLHTARWRMFLSHVRPLVERQVDDGKKHSFRFQRYEFVRLKPDETPCEDCGNNRYISYWPGPNQKAKYKCLVCSLPKAPEIPVKQSAPRAGAAKRKRPPKVYPVVEQTKVLPTPTPLPQVKEVVVITPTHGLVKRQPKPEVKKDPLEEAWLFIVTKLENGERGNHKLRRSMRLAFDMGLINEYQQINLFKTEELNRLGYPVNELQTNEIVKSRAAHWINLELGQGNKILPPDVRRRCQWVPHMINAYAVASLSVITIGAEGELEKIDALIADLRKKRMQNTPPPPTPKEPRLRWGAPMKTAKNVLSRWFIK